MAESHLGPLRHQRLLGNRSWDVVCQGGTWRHSIHTERRTFPAESLGRHYFSEKPSDLQRFLCGRIIFRDTNYTNVNWIAFWITIVSLTLVCLASYTIGWIDKTTRKACGLVKRTIKVLLSKQGTKNCHELVGVWIARMTMGDTEMLIVHLKCLFHSSRKIEHLGNEGVSVMSSNGLRKVLK